MTSFSSLSLFKIILDFPPAFGHSCMPQATRSLNHAGFRVIYTEPRNGFVLFILFFQYPSYLKERFIFSQFDNLRQSPEYRFVIKAVSALGPLGFLD
jgi:hypothetical protein